MGKSPIERTFVGWSQPLVRAVVDHLIAQQPDFDFSNVMLVLSGGRVGRRIMSLLVDEAETRGVAMVPPELLTPGSLPERLHRPPCPEAKSLARRVAWARALQQNESATRTLFPRVAAGADLTALYSPAMMMEQCHRELAGACENFDSVAARDFGVDGESRSQRWSAASAIYQSYLRELKTMGLCDIQEARNDAIKTSKISTSKKIVLAGIAQLTPQLRRMLEIASAKPGASAPGPSTVESIIFTPPELSDHFDDFGCVKTIAWLDREIDLDAADVRIVPSSADQAAEAFAAIGSRGGAITSDQITIGVTDDSLVAHLQAEAQNLSDVPVRYGPGKSVAQTRPYVLLAVAADYLESGAFREFARLVRHPDVEDFLVRRCEAEGATSSDWRTLLDSYACAHLPDRLTDAQRAVDGWRRDPDARANDDDRPHLAWLYCAVEEFLQPLRSAASASPGQLAKHVLALLSRAYAFRPWKQNAEGDRIVTGACQEIRGCLDELRELPDASASMTAAEAIRAVLSLAASCQLPPPLDGGEIEMVGWLELMPDDAEHLIVTGFNDGSVPDSAKAGPFLTGELRQKLGLVTDDDRFARDAYLLSAMLASRPPNHVTLITARASVDGDPMLPSRLLFACDRRKLAERVMGVMDDRKRTPRVGLSYRFQPAPRSEFPRGATIPPRERIPVIESMRVTSFREYLRSPQGFYLQNVLRLQTVEDTAPRELDARQSGSLVHAALKNFARDPAASSSSAQQCTDALLTTFQSLARTYFGSAPPAALKFQLALIEDRLQHLAAWHATWVRDGWRIHESEWKSEQQPMPSLLVDGLPMGLRGRIDRIDVRGDGANREWAIFDYKLCGRKKTPEEMHLVAGEWCDLQLPLYRHLAREIIAGNPVKLGYIVIADVAKDIGLADAKWDDAALADADAAAAAVIRAVRNGEFTEEGNDPPTDGAFCFIFNADLIETSDDAEQGDAQ